MVVNTISLTIVNKTPQPGFAAKVPLQRIQSGGTHSYVALR
jgi:hypothetical protein